MWYETTKAMASSLAYMVAEKASRPGDDIMNDIRLPGQQVLGCPDGESWGQQQNQGFVEGQAEAQHFDHLQHPSSF